VFLEYLLVFNLKESLATSNMPSSRYTIQNNMELHFILMQLNPVHASITVSMKLNLSAYNLRVHSSVPSVIYPWISVHLCTDFIQLFCYTVKQIYFSR
jgi:hypothetical protein